MVIRYAVCESSLQAKHLSGVRWQQSPLWRRGGSPSSSATMAGAEAPVHWPTVLYCRHFCHLRGTDFWTATSSLSSTCDPWIVFRSARTHNRDIASTCRITPTTSSASSANSQTKSHLQRHLRSEMLFAHFPSEMHLQASGLWQSQNASRRSLPEEARGLDRQHGLMD